MFVRADDMIGVFFHVIDSTCIPILYVAIISAHCRKGK